MNLFLRPAACLASLAVLALAGGCAGQPTMDTACKARSAGPQCVTTPARTAASLLPGAGASFVVDAQCEWNRSGVLLQRDGEYRLEAKPHGPEAWMDQTTAADPDTGWTENLLLERWLRWQARAPELPMYTLVAAQGQQGPRSLAGKAGTVHAQVQNEELFLYANDWWGRYGNNHGCLDVTVLRVR